MIIKTAVIGLGALVATLALGASTRSVVCRNHAIGDNPGLLFCDGDIDKMVLRSAEGDAGRALDPWRRDAFVAALKRHAESDYEALPWQVARSGNRDAMRLLIAAGANLNFAPPSDNGSTSALGGATDAGDLPMMQLLLDAGARIDGPDPARIDAPLSVAARDGQRAAAQLLLARGADPDGGIPATALTEGRTDPMNVVRMGRRPTPVYAALNGLHAQGREVARDSREVAVLLVQNGATIMGGDGVNEAMNRYYGDDMRGSDRWKALSILLALAARSERWDAMVARLREATGPLWISDRMPRRPNPDAVLRPYVDAVAKCGSTRIRAERDYFAFCPDGGDRRIGIASAGHPQVRK